MDRSCQRSKVMQMLIKEQMRVTPTAIMGKGCFDANSFVEGGERVPILGVKLCGARCRTKRGLLVLSAWYEKWTLSDAWEYLFEAREIWEDEFEGRTSRGRKMERIF